MSIVDYMIISNVYIAKSRITHTSYLMAGKMMSEHEIVLFVLFNPCKDAADAKMLSITHLDGQRSYICLVKDILHTI